jgi:hypothetical protein
LRGAEAGGPGPEPQPIPEPQPGPAASYEYRPANVLGGVFLIGCGLCLLLVGGGCTILLVLTLIEGRGSGEASGLLVWLAVAGGGIFAIGLGSRMARGRSGR